MSTFKDLSNTGINQGGTLGMWSSANNTKQVIVIHDTESGNAAGAINWMRSQQNGSYHTIFDTNGDGFRMVPDNRQSWSAMTTGNRIGLHICATGYASWRLRFKNAMTSPNEWNSYSRYDGACGSSKSRKATTIKWTNYPLMLEQMAVQIASWSKLYSIPLVTLNASQVRAGQRGVCGHNEISLAFGESDHTDPGPNFPKMTVINRAIAINNGSANLLGLTDAQLREVAVNFQQLGPT